MKIAIYVPSWPPGKSSNGVVTYASQLIPAMRELGHDVFVLTSDIGDDERDVDTFDLRRFALAPTVFDRAIWRIAPASATFRMMASSLSRAVSELVEKHAIDVFEMEETGGWSASISSRKLIPVVVRLHGPWFLTGGFDRDVVPAWCRGREKREGKGIRGANCVTAPTAEVLQAVRRFYGMRSSDGRIIPNPLRAVPEVQAWDSASFDKDTVLFVGRFDALKGGDLLLYSFVELALRRPQVKLTFVGPDVGIRGNDGLMCSFARFVQSKVPDHIRPRIKFLGQINHSAVMSLRRKHFLTVVASQQEMMPYSVLEAMSVGCPIVATGVGGIPEVIRDNHNGLIVPSQDARAMTAACEKLLDDHRLAMRLGRQAWEDCRVRYGPAEIAKKTIEVYRETVEKSRYVRALR